MTETGEAAGSVEDRVTGLYLALLDAGVPVDQPAERRWWENAVRAASGVSSTPALRYHTKAARDMGLIEVVRGTRAEPGTVRLLPPDHGEQFIPSLVAAELTVEQALAALDPEPVEDGGEAGGEDGGG